MPVSSKTRARPPDAPTASSSGAQERPARTDGSQRRANRIARVMAIAVSISGLEMPT